ncbi:unnamed protein product [Cyclocybe aegerita]|uniref:Uncharacterized protein n=1 Tax=Cyclocybe aegerita TaxID=1973307 RepID=A0A8S0WKU1_CYCAE|nr:unnamed protein product [Cyclocybe aegerita]
MVAAVSMVADTPSSPDTDSLPNAVSELSTPVSQSGRASPMYAVVENLEDSAATTQRKKKKKKSKKSSKSKDAASKTNGNEEGNTEGRPPVLCISRNKHWRYISSYHGPWLQLPLELLDSLLTLNLDPATLTGPETTRLPPLLPPPSTPSSKQRDRTFHGPGDFSPPESPRTTYSSLPLPPPFPPPKPGKATPPPIDPGVFRSVKNIRRLIDEAAELSVRASSGLSAAELGSMRSNSGLSGSPWAAAQSLGLNPLGNPNGNGRNVGMSPTRIHRLRVLAVQKLAEAYKSDEIASSVMVMQGGSVFDDVAERVLKTDPHDTDAKYVHFFHEKIPSRQLAESTTTRVLDELIALHPQRLHYYRTRGIVHCFRDEFSQATKDFTYALKEARAVRKAHMAHHNNGSQSESRTSKNSKRRKGSSANRTNGQAPPDGTSTMENNLDSSDGEPLLKHPSVLDDAPNPIEPQLLFLRGAAYLQHAVHLIESAVLKIEGIRKAPSVDGAELRLCYIENGKYGGTEIGNPDGPLGERGGKKLAAYTEVLGKKPFRECITQLLKKSLRDHEKFLAHFDSLESPNAMPDGDLAFQTEYAFLLSESIRPGNHNNMPPPMTDAPAMFTTYHPLLVESMFSVLICQLMLADFANLLPAFIRTALVVDGLEGYPIFLPPRSMSQAEFIEVLERLAGGWKVGVQPHSLSAQRGKARLAIEPPPPVPPAAPTIKRSDSYNESEEKDRVTGFSSPSTKRSETSGITNGVGASGSSKSLNGHALQADYALDDLIHGSTASSSRSTTRKSSMSNGIGPSTSTSNGHIPEINGLDHAFDDSTCERDSYFSSTDRNGEGTNLKPSGSCNGHAFRVDSLQQALDDETHLDPSASHRRADAAGALDCARILLAPVFKRQRERAEKAAAEKASSGGKKKPVPINIPLHGPRVEIILAWLGAVHLPELNA